jgi:serine/threonine protein kinase
MKYEPELVVGGYVLKKKIGGGGEAEVWTAYHRRTGTIRALKLCAPIPYDDRKNLNKQLERVESEKDSILRFSDSLYIVTLHDIITEFAPNKETPEFVVVGISLEYSEHGDLDKALKSGKIREFILNELDFIEFISCIANGLLAGHTSQKIHCDIKPQNVLLFIGPGNELIPKMTDFGVSVDIFQTIVGGTPGYQAPELEPGTTPTFFSDIYSLGIMFYEILFFCVINDAKETYKPSSYSSGEEYKTYIQYSGNLETVISKWPVNKYKVLFAKMVNVEPENRLRISDVLDFLRLEKTNLIARGSIYEPRVTRNRYHWNPEIHRRVGEDLYFIFLKGGIPEKDLRFIKSDFSNTAVEGYCLYSVSGRWDYIIRLWANSEMIPEIEEMVLQRRSTTGGYEISRVREYKLFSKTKNNLEMNTKELFTKVEECARGDDEFKLLKNSGFVSSVIDEKRKMFRVFVIVEVMNKDGVIDNILDVYADMMKKAVSDSDTKAKEISTYVVEPVGEQPRSDTRIILKFIHSNFLICRETLMIVYNSFSRYSNKQNMFSFSTMFHMTTNNDIMSDDGHIFRWISKELS